MNEIDGPIPTAIGLLTKLTDLRVSPRPRPCSATAPRRRRYLNENEIDGPVPPEIGQLTALQYLRVPPASSKPGAVRDRPSRRRRWLQDNKINGPIPTEFGQLTKLDHLRVPRVPDARRAARPPSATQVPRQKRDRRPDPD